MKIKYSKILILGNGGSGKSTLAKKLGQYFSIPILHLDKIYWVNDWQKNNSELFDKQVYDFALQDKWIIEGTPMRGLYTRILAADMIIIIKKDILLCFFNLLKPRFFSFFSFIKKSDDGCPAVKLSLKTFRWIWKYNQKIYPIILEKLKTAQKKAECIKTGKDIDLLIKKITA